MKRTLCMLIAALWCCGSAAAQDIVRITMTNPTNTYRTNETVQVEWNAITARLSGVSPQNVVVRDAIGIEVTSQVVYNGTTQPQHLIFQLSIGEYDTMVYTISTGVRSNYAVLALGRYVPRRRDDYAWENNVAAYRVYGKSLEDETISAGMDFWGKTIVSMVLDRWYMREFQRKGTYHRDYGEGNDCYKVGSTLGVGGSAVLYNGTMVMPNHNYSEYAVLDNGPLRTAVRLRYPAFAVGKDSVVLTKTIVLDANTNFNVITDTYSSTADSIDVAAGLAMHRDAQVDIGDGWIAVWERASDSRYGNDGWIGVGVVLPRASASSLNSHALLKMRIASGASLVYRAGAATTKRGVSNHEWQQMVKQQVLPMNSTIAVEAK